VKTSPNAIGVGFATSVLKVSMKRVLCITRSLMPSKSSAFPTGRRLLVMLRKPFSQ
jgi:hypothetical protein